MTTCPRDASQLQTRKEHSIEIDECPQCRGAWYDFDELQMLEASVATGDAMRGMIEYSKRPGELKCPACGKIMTAFDYRATSLELDVCPDEHGFWLDAGESERVLAEMQSRIKGLARLKEAEDRWNKDREGGFKGPGLMDKVRGMFKGK